MLLVSLLSIKCKFPVENLQCQKVFSHSIDFIKRGNLTILACVLIGQNRRKLRLPFSKMVE